MQSLQYSTSGTTTIAVWPEVTSSLAGNASASFDMVMTNDYGEQETTISLTLLNQPTSVTPRLVFSLNNSSLPTYTGFYTFTLRERVGVVSIWGQIQDTWQAYSQQWGAASAAGTGTALDTDRAWVSGSDVPSYTQYTSPTETGAYSIYHG